MFVVRRFSQFYLVPVIRFGVTGYKGFFRSLSKVLWWVDDVEKSYINVKKD